MFNIIMKELQFLNIINKTLTDTQFLGEDCAYLRDLNLYITQDTLCEGVHFDLKYIDFFTLAKKAVAVNLSDLAANLAKPEYITVSLSLPENFNESDFEEFYKGIEYCCKLYKIKVVGGDITGSKNKICISICAIGKPLGNTKISRGFAKKGQIICVTGNYGSSAYALQCLLNGKNCSNEILKTHLNPAPDLEISKKLAGLNYTQMAVMDSSDGLCDALYKMAEASDKTFEIDFDKIPFDKEIMSYPNYKDLIFWGGEDYSLVFCIDEKDLTKVGNDVVKIGKVSDFQNDCRIKIGDFKIDKKTFLKKCYNHFKEEK